MTTEANPESTQNGSTGPQIVCAPDSPLVPMIRACERIARGDTTVLVTGETGVGKETVARVIHGLSHRALGPLVRVSCGALPEKLLEAELFGAEGTAGAGGKLAAAEGGTLLLGDVAELPPGLQARLLQALQELPGPQDGREIDLAGFRLVATTAHDLAAEVAAGRFRRDLYYRLLVCPVEVPPLRARRGDIRLLFQHLCDRHGERRPLEPGVTELLQAYDWPGNVRELENVVKRLKLWAEGPTIRPADLPAELQGAGGASPRASQPADLHSSPARTTVSVPAPAPDAVFDLELLRALAAQDASPLVDPSFSEGQSVDLPRLLRKLEEAYISAALARTGGNKKAAADLLGLQRTTLVEKLRRWHRGASASQS